MGRETRWEKPLSIAAALAPLAAAAAATAPINFADLNLSPIALDLGFFKIRWYSLGYIGAILGGWWYLNRLLALPGAPMAKRHTDDLILNATLGIILGGRLGYALFYKPSMFANPLELLKLWEGGMAFHGGLIGLLVGIWLLTWRNKLSMLRVADYVTVVAPLGPLFVRPANFINGELWGRVTDVPWAIVFPGAGPLPRHPSQLYEMALEGAVLLLIMAYAFFRTDARYYPGRLLGIGMLFYGAARTVIETVREPDAGLENLSWGLTMGQTLSIPMILLGFWLIATSKARRARVEAIGGTASVA
jgi:phosphatidylglycerol---prolipoprotein diacylglyceryl transferase